ncbi:MAG: calcium-translocating P-type ATPase, PMCA-type [Lentimicrobiaceae bacterium]|nr:calcium-translocating P-type ATPase, PMCA-type [Lentimicrobiaceae bacterium]
MIHKGLTNQQVEESRKKHGSNVLTPPEKESLWHQFLEKFKDPIIRILLIALALSVGVSLYQYFTTDEGIAVLFEPIGIFVAIMLATCIGFAFEVSANKKFEVLNKVSDDEEVKVVRNGNITVIGRKEIVVGDVVIIETGDEVPADGELIDAFSLQVNESDLTGEPMATKTIDPKDFKKDATYPSNYVLRGSKVIDGHGVMIVDKVGDATEWGKVYQGSQIDNNIKTPLDNQLDHLGKIITVASYIIAGVILVMRLVMYFTSGESESFEWLSFAHYLLNTLMMAVTIIVVSVPEGLPMSVTLSLALSMKRMLTANNLVRKMHACETMGAATVICTDKTGTLTQNQMSVNDMSFPALPEKQLSNNEISNLIKESLALNTTAFLDFSDEKKIKAIGNPTEGALLLWLNKQGVDYMQLREGVKMYQQVPFSTKYKFMASIVESPAMGKPIFYVKGAPEILLKHCNKIATPEGNVDITPYRLDVEKQLLEYQGKAMRTLAFAYKVGDPNEQSFDPNTDDLVAENFILLGVVAIADPIRGDVAEAVKNCMSAGIDVKIVTGDTPGTAIEIGRQLGLWLGTDSKEVNHITGKDWEALSDEEALKIIHKIKIMSRARPMDKERLVRLLQSEGEVVAVTGDGTNDAPALKAAQVGLSMGDGTTVAKEASDITILDNSFNSIARAVMWGRSLYINIQRFVVFQMTINVAACLIVMLGALLGTEMVLTVTQMLWVNLIMDTFAALALASLPPSEMVMKEKPRSREANIITKPMMWQIFGVGILFVLFMFGLVQYFKHADITSLADFSFAEYFRNYFNFNIASHAISPIEQTYIFTIFVFLQFWNLFNAKAFHSDGSALKGLLRKDVLAGFGLALLVIFGGQYLIVTLGGEMFNVAPMSWNDWLYIIVGTFPVLFIGEAMRAIKKLVKN